MISSVYSPNNTFPCAKNYDHGGAGRTVPLAEKSITSTSITSSTTVVISGETSPLLGSRSTGVGAYKSVDAVKPAVDAAAERNPYSTSILSAIELQLQKDVDAGATPEELQSRIQAGLDGFEQGYSEAYKQLSDSGLLGDGVASAIKETLTQVRAGIASLAEQFGLSLPLSSSEDLNTSSVVTPESLTSSDPVQTVSSISSTISTVEERFTQSHRDMQTIKYLQNMRPESSTYDHLNKSKSSKIGNDYSYSVAESREFTFKLKTQDGDVVTVNIRNSQQGTTTLQIPQYAGQQAEVGVYGGQDGNYELDIDGDLDSAELDAISDLLSQVGDISEMFYSGDMDEAINMASSIAFDTQELSGFNLKLEMSSSEQFTESRPAHRRPQYGFAPSVGFQGPQIEPFSSKVKIAGEIVERLGQSKVMVPELLSWVGQQQHNGHHFTPLIGPMAQAMS